MRQPEVFEEVIRRPVGHRPPRAAPSAAQSDHAHLQQQVERALRQGHAPNALNFRAGDRLVIGDDGQGLERRLGQLARFLALLGHQERQVLRRPERPAIGHADQFHAPSRIARPERRDRLTGVSAFRQPPRDLRQGQRPGGGEQQGLDPALDLGLIGREDAHWSASRTSVSRRVLTKTGANASIWRAFRRPSFTSSRLAERVEAR